MDSAGYVALTRQSGLMREMGVVANNIANISTSGFRREGVVFEEYVKRVDNGPSLSMATGDARNIDLSQGALQQTGGAYDFAVQGDGFFLIETPDGQRLTRSGSFTPSANGELVNNDGYRLLDEGGAAIAVPADASKIAMAEDGTLSSNGAPFAKVGLWQPTDPLTLKHESGTLFSASGQEPKPDGMVLQGYLEDSNVNPISEIARMIEVQRAYELGQTFLDKEDQRIRGVVQTLGR